MDSQRQTAKQAGDYYRIDYDPYLGRYSHHRPDWWNVFGYFDAGSGQDVGWYDVIASALALRQREINVGHLAENWPRASMTFGDFDKSWLRSDLQVDNALAASVLLLSGVDKASESERLRNFNANVGSKPREQVKNSWPRPYRISERPVCLAVWFIDKRNARANLTLGRTLQALAAAYFRSRWVA